MRRLLLIPLLSLSVAAGQTFRVGQHVLSVGNAASHAIDLLGTPSYKEPRQNKYGAHVGERGQYLHDSGHVVIVSIIAGRVANIDDLRS